MTDNTIIAVAFEENSKAYQALSELRQAADQGRVDLKSAAIVERTADGHLQVPDGEDDVTGTGTVTGSLAGMLVGVLGGPVGMLLGWGAGALIGGSVDLDRASGGAEVLTEFSQAVPPGRTALIAEVDEVTPEVVDGIMTPLGGTVLRRPVDEVVAELEAAEDAAEAAEAEARRVVREQKHAERKEKLEERVEALKKKLHIGKKK